MNWKIVLFYVVMAMWLSKSLTDIAYAHDSDRSLPIINSLNIPQTVEFKECVDDYWHCRREIDANSDDYTLEFGQVVLLSVLTGAPIGIVIDHAFMNYSQVVPARPAIEGPRIHDEQGRVVGFHPTSLNHCIAHRDTACGSSGVAQAEKNLREITAEKLRLLEIYVNQRR